MGAAHGALPPVTGHITVTMASCHAVESGGAGVGPQGHEDTTGSSPRPRPSPNRRGSSPFGVALSASSPGDFLPVRGPPPGRRPRTLPLRAACEGEARGRAFQRPPQRKVAGAGLYRSGPLHCALTDGDGRRCAGGPVAARSLAAAPTPVATGTAAWMPHPSSLQGQRREGADVVSLGTKGNPPWHRPGQTQATSGIAGGVPSDSGACKCINTCISD